MASALGKTADWSWVPQGRTGSQRVHFPRPGRKQGAGSGLRRKWLV